MKFIPGQKRFKINKDGVVFDVIKKRNITKTKKSTGYIVVALLRKQKFIHRLLALSYIPNPDNKPFINHKNGIRDDNRLENLEWCTHQENQIHSWKELGRAPGRCRSVSCHKNGVIVRTFTSVAEACRVTKTDPSHVFACLRGADSYHTCGGYIWEYGSS